MLARFVNKIAPNVSPLEGNTIENDERISFGVIAATNIGAQVDAIDWSDSIIERCRFDSTTISNASFERVVILDCDLSGVSFSNCLLRECLIVGVKSKSHFALDNCILDRVMIARSRTDRIEIVNSNITEMDFLGVESTQVSFHQCKAHKRIGRVSFEECEFEKVAGLEFIVKNGVKVFVDKLMWRDLGDSYLRERGFQQLESSTTANYALLDEIGSNSSS
ncbi:MAG: pentapeptide repeat-containing protein [Granulosicoccus sp.]